MLSFHSSAPSPAAPGPWSRPPGDIGTVVGTGAARLATALAAALLFFFATPAHALVLVSAPAHALLLVTTPALALPAASTPVQQVTPAETGSLHGRVTEDSGAALRGVVVQVAPVTADGGAAEDSRTGALTDELGYWHLEGLVSGRYRLEAIRLGYATADTTVVVSPGERVEVNLTLEPRAVELEGISVEAERSRQRARFEIEAGGTTQELTARELRAIPGLLEADPLRAVEILPGVITTSDFSSAYNVRGGSADQNLILLDGVPVFNPTHLGGVFSIFNPDMIDRAELSSGGFPPEYGGRVSSVLEVETDPGEGSFHGEAGISLLASRLALGGGLSDGTTDFLGLADGRWKVSGRRSYFDVLFSPFIDFPYHLNDVQGIFEGWTEGGDRIILSAYTGRDVLDLTTLDSEDFPLRLDWEWGNDAVGVKWDRPREGGGALRGGVSWSRFSSGLAFPDFQDSAFRSEIEQLRSRLSLEGRPLPSLTLSVGAAADRYRYDNLARTGGTEFTRGGGRGWQLQSWVQAGWERPDRWLVEGGVRGDVWLADPGGTEAFVSPRLSVKRFVAGGDWAVKASVGRYTQFLHSIRDEELPLGLDFWVLTGNRTPPVVSDQVQAGVEGFPADDWFVSLEAYLREFDGVTTPNGADDPNLRTDDFLTGSGRSWGADALIRRSLGPTTGWIAVSFLRARRTFPDVLSGVDPAPEITFPPVFDRRLDVDLALSRTFGADLEVGIRWNVGTGLPYTRPVASYHLLGPRGAFGGRIVWDAEEDEGDGNDGEGGGPDGGYAVLLGPRNGARYPVRHRLDLSVRKTFRRDWGTLVPYVNVLNVYNQTNVLFYFYEYQKDPPVRTGISMFPFLPTLGLDVTF